jgi:membrane protease YdiL (CAAX protease family)
VTCNEHDPVGGSGEPPHLGTRCAEPIVANPPRPFGLLSTFGWLVAALAAASLSATLVILVFVFVFDVTYRESQADLLSDGRTVAVVGTALVVAAMSFFAVIAAACRRSGWRAAEYLALARPKGRHLPAGLAAFLFPLMFSLIAARFGALATDDPPAPAPTALALLSLFLGAVIFAPITEELIFRGFLYRGLAASRLGGSGAIVATATLWAALHADRTWLGYLDLLSTGIALGWLRWRSDSTIPTISVHALRNLLAVGWVLNWGTAT